MTKAERSLWQGPSGKLRRDAALVRLLNLTRKSPVAGSGPARTASARRNPSPTASQPERNENRKQLVTAGRKARQSLTRLPQGTASSPRRCQYNHWKLVGEGGNWTWLDAPGLPTCGKGLRTAPAWTWSRRPTRGASLLLLRKAGGAAQPHLPLRGPGHVREGPGGSHLSRGSFSGGAVSPRQQPQQSPSERSQVPSPIGAADSRAGRAGPGPPRPPRPHSAAVAGEGQCRQPRPCPPFAAAAAAPAAPLRGFAQGQSPRSLPLPTALCRILLHSPSFCSLLYPHTPSCNPPAFSSIFL